jgi:hypothetical protein
VGGVLDSGFKNNMGAVREQNQNGGYMRAPWGFKMRKIAG